MTPIRPNLPPIPPQTPARTPDARQAFFRIALGEAVAPTPAAAVVPEAAPTQAKAEPVKASEPLVGRLPRPGSLLDIKV